MVHPFDAVQIALMDGVDAHIACAALGAGGLANPDGIAHRSGLHNGHPARLVAGALAQVVQVRNRQIGQAHVAGVAIDDVSALQEVRDGRTAHVVVGPIHLHEQLHILGCVLARERHGRGTVLLDQRMLRDTVDRPTRDQARELRAAVAACASQVGQHHAALAFVALRVVKPRQHAADVRVALVVSPYTRGCERHLGRRLEEFLQLLDRAQPCLVHVDHHPCDDQPTPRYILTGPPSGSFLVGNARPVQAHTTLDKAPGCLAWPAG